jgi:peptidoglycan/xylan/chitin deacetylase (PgdA/CDA1 family)
MAMKFLAMMKELLLVFTIGGWLSGCTGEGKILGNTEITKWQYGKKGAVSLTYDDGSTNQFSRAFPIMRRLKLPATFFVITGPIIGSHYQGKFIGRPVKEIIRETAHVPTSADNFFERASAARYLGYKGTIAFYDRSDARYESGKKELAYAIMDSLYSIVRSGALKPGETLSNEVMQEKGLTWNSLKQYAAEGYEPASHTVTHAHLAELDTANMLYELEKSKADIQEHLGTEYTFSAEVPYGIEDSRVMKYGLPVYPALRNSMPEPFMKEINRGYKDQPGASDKEYVQWQRGPLSKTSLDRMQSWVDTTLAHDNIWLVLVFHGVDSIGWEALPHELLDTYFQFIKKHDDSLWIATFGDVARYIRERMNSKVHADVKENEMLINLNHSLDTGLYKLPLTLKTYTPAAWKGVQVKQGDKIQWIQPENDEKGTYILYQATPNTEPIRLSEEKS